MRFGILAPNFGHCCGSAKELARLAVEGENAGWDGFFLFDQMLFSIDEIAPMVDPWIALTAIALKTERIRIGTLVTPIARRRPWKLARETVSLDHLSEGRLTLGVGLGDPPETEFAHFGENGENLVRARKLDEGLDILVGLWRGEELNYQGEYFKVQGVQFLPRSFQSPRIPIWVAGRWPRLRPFLRAARWDGVFPLGLSIGSKLNPEELRSVVNFVRNHRTDTSPYDVVATSGADGHVEKTTISAYAAVGTTWWMQDMRKWRNSRDDLLTQIAKGPPRT